MKCPVYKAFCSEHGFAHGAEAEDLRKGIEGLLSDGTDVSFIDLQRLLDRVDARDSLAFQEAQDESEEEELAAREKALFTLDNFLASWFGGPGERFHTEQFLKKFAEDGFSVSDQDGRAVEAS